jgi:cation:H+ antiporter
MELVLAIAAFGGGAWLLVEAVETLVGALRGWATAAGLSGVVLAALVLGLDLESTAAGVAATLDDLPGTALGTSIGAAILLLTLGLGLAGLVAPFRVRPPTGMLAAAAIAAAVPSVLALDGALTRVEGAVLVALFPPLVWLVARGRREPAPPEGARPTRPPRLVPRLLLALAGLVLGAELLVWGTGRIVGELDLSETVFGLLIVAAAVCFEELVLEMLPAYRGFPELSVGNALGTLVFLLTASLGVIVLVRPLAVPDAVVELHVPVLLGATAVVVGLLARGRIGRAEGAGLAAAYVAYVIAAILVG